MEIREVIEKIKQEKYDFSKPWTSLDRSDYKEGYNDASDDIIGIVNQLDEPTKVIAHLAEKWHEDIGPVLWWDFPVEEPPYCGTPLDDDFPKYKRHFTELHIPDEVEEEPKWVFKIEDNGSAYFVDFFDELQPHLVYGLSGEVMRFDSEDKANAIVTLIECGTVEKV
ncbi:hypothetical protein [Enterococcus avium]|uniref:hypothetical protein n=1 Tax=Enterococcus avium TaxID=33945 RepID=UPI0022E85479|nr:hypothetical protein [Enterococcus avium]MDB1728419.1 hypothetical protein [Enterococcus avium]MDB1734070.1 hypothetical protein [Enterococcus avium]